MLDLSEIRAVTEKTTSGPWNRNGDELEHDGWMAEFVRDEDAEFCAASRQWVPTLCDEVEADRVRIAELESRLSESDCLVADHAEELHAANKQIAVLKRALEMAEQARTSNSKAIKELAELHVKYAREEMNK